MAYDQDELNKRRRAREEQRKKREAAQRRLYFRLAVAAVVLVICGVGIFALSRGNSEEQDQQALSTDVTENTTQATETTAASWEKDPNVIHVVAAGDLNVTDSVVWSGLSANTYDYTRTFMDVAPIFSEADLAVLNFEGTVSGAPYGSAYGSAPIEMIEALKRAGVDLLQVANSCSVNNGFSGLVSTLSSIRSAGIEPVGAFSGPSEFKKAKGYTICNAGDIKIAMVAFTKGMNGRGLPEGSEDCVNLLYTDYTTNYREVDTEGIKQVLKSAESEKPDITIALLHWGSEYNDEISASQKSIVSLMQSNGVDVIIGTHSHMVHQIDYNESSGQLVAYSLGDFFGDATRSGTNYSIMLDLEITKDYDTGVTKVTDYTCIPIYTLAETDCDGRRRVVRIENAVAAYNLNYVDKITANCHASMENSLNRIMARISGK